MVHRPSSIVHRPQGDMDVKADIILVGGTVLPMDKRHPPAQAIALGQGRILALGTDDEVLHRRGPATRVIRLHGRTVLPGFTDGHIHLVEWALQRQQVNLWGVTSLAETLSRIRRVHAALPPGVWLRGGGWDASVWQDAGGAEPTAALLDQVAGDRPVALDSKDLHALWVNSYTLRLAGITAHTPDPPGGVIVRDPVTGQPTGVLKETARELVTRLYPPESEADWVRALEAAQPALWAEGIVAVHVLNDTDTMRNFRTLQILRERNALRLRALVYFPASRQEEAIRLGLRSGFGDTLLRVGGIKYFADGTLGSRTAALFEPYMDGQNNTGIFVTDPEEMMEGIQAASRAGLAVAVHAIGDRANRVVLDILTKVRTAEKEYLAPALPHRVEHVQLLQPEDLERFVSLGVVASMQPFHATQDMDLARAYWGEERNRWAYPWRSLLRTGARLIFGSDAPVEPPSVLQGLHAALTRRRADGSPGPEGWIPQERLCLLQALHAYTLAPAEVEGTAHWRGSLAPGKVADLVVLSGPLLPLAREDPMALLELRVDMTIFEGEIVYQREA